MGVEPKIWENPQIIPCLIRFSIIFTIHFGGFKNHPPIFGGKIHPYQATRLQIIMGVRIKGSPLEPILWR